MATWKYKWNPAGYGEETIELSLVGFKKGDCISLPHTYFKWNPIKAEMGSQSLVFNVTDDNCDFMFYNKQVELSGLTGTLVFSQLKICSDRVLSQLITFHVTFLGDEFDPEWLNQYLHQDADVIHKSITATTVISSPLAYIKGIRNLSKLDGEFGEISKDSLTFVSPSLKVSNTELTQGSLKFGDTAYSIGNDKASIIYDDTKKSFLLKIGANVSGTILKGLLNTQNTALHIPFIAFDDPTRIAVLPWLKVIPDKKALYSEQILFGKASYINENELVIKEQKDYSIKVDDFEIIKKQDNLLIVGNSIVIDLITKSVKINSLPITELYINNVFSLVNKIKEQEKVIEAMKKDINDLKGRIK